MPRLPRNLHLVATWRSPDNAIRKNTQHDTSKVLRLPRKMTMDTSKVLRLPRKLQRIFENVAKVLRLPHKTTFDTLQNTSECHEVPRLPRETKQRDVWNLQKWPFCRTYHRHGHTVASRGRLRTVADGCERKRNVERTHPQPPDPQSETGTLATHSVFLFLPRLFLHISRPEPLPWIGVRDQKIYI